MSNKSKARYVLEHHVKKVGKSKESHKSLFDEKSFIKIADRISY